MAKTTPAPFFPNWPMRPIKSLYVEFGRFNHTSSLIFPALFLHFRVKGNFMLMLCKKSSLEKTVVDFEYVRQSAIVKE